MVGVTRVDGFLIDHSSAPGGKQFRFTPDNFRRFNGYLLLLAENYNWKENCGTTNQGFCIEIKNKDILINKFGAPTMKPSEGVYYGQNLNPKIIQLHPNLMELHVEKIQNIINITYYKQ